MQQTSGSNPTQGKQFNTFSNDSYAGNLGLCGLPLSKMCNENETQQPLVPSFARERNVSGSKFGFGWKIVLLRYGYGVMFGLIMGYRVFPTGKPQWLVMIVDGIQPQKQKRSKLAGRRHQRNN